MPRAAASIDLDQVGEHTMIRLDAAARLAFPDGSIGISSLRREAARGRLVIWRVANKDMTTLAEIRSMVDRCRVQPSPPDCGSAPPATDAPRAGSSSTVDVSTAQAALRMRVERLKAASSASSPPSMMPRLPVNVVPIKTL